MAWEAYWRKVVAPQLRAKKNEIGRGVPGRRIAFELQQETGQVSSPSLFRMWLKGDREPTVTQFLALCEKLDLPWAGVLKPVMKVSHRAPLRRTTEKSVTPRQLRSRTRKNQKVID